MTPIPHPLAVPFGPPHLLVPLVEWAVAAISAVAVGVALWGVAVGLVQFARVERARLGGLDHGSEADRLRRALGFYALLTLSFLVAADILETLIRPTFEHLAVLAGVVGIRVATGFTLTRELREPV